MRDTINYPINHFDWTYRNATPTHTNIESTESGSQNLGPILKQARLNGTRKGIIRNGDERSGATETQRREQYQLDTKAETATATTTTTATKNNESELARENDEVMYEKTKEKSATSNESSALKVPVASIS